MSQSHTPSHSGVPTNCYISSDKSKLDTSMICDFLINKAYWAKGRDKKTVLKSIENSLCFGLYQNDSMVGFARVITDYSTFAWILDLFVLEVDRGNGLGKKLMDSIITDTRLQGMIRWRLNTHDAHAFYEKFGFRKTEQSETYMEKL
ncbi:MAG: GNAT family N-acetyltransferase [Cyclobacteriaceae bacterium]